MKIQEFREALRDDEVKSLFQKMFDDKIEQCVRNTTTAALTEITEKFTKKVDELNLNILSLKAEVQRKDQTIGLLAAENQQLKDTVEILNVKVGESESYQRRENLILTGLEVRTADRVNATSDPLAQSSNTLLKKIIDFCTDVLHCNVDESDISIAHLLPSKDANSPPAVMVRFVRRSVRDEVYSARSRLKNYTTPSNNKIFINEDLTAMNRKILGVLRAKLRNKVIAGAWSQSGRIMAKTLRDSVKHIATLADAHAFQ